MLRRSFPFVACTLFAAALACKGDADGGTPRNANARSASGSVGQESAGEVVIAAPKGAYTVSSNAAAASVSGSVTLDGALPPAATYQTGKDAAICGPTITDDAPPASGAALGGTVVWLDGVRSGKAPPIERRLELESDHCKLVPRVQAALVGSAVNVIGHDDIRQHLKLSAAGESAPRAAILLGGGEQVIPTELPFRAPGLVVVRDDERPWTRAYLAVFDHPYFAVTGANGAFTIDGVPAGKYTLKAWHEGAEVTEQSVDVGANGVVKADVKLKAAAH